MIVYERNGVVVRDSCEADIVALKDRLREADEKEIIAAGNRDGQAALEYSYAHSTLRYTVDLDGVPVAMFGIVPESILGLRANVWFLGAAEMSRIKKTFVKFSKVVIAHFLSFYPELFNYVDVRYHDTIKWLLYCGASFETTDYRGPSGLRFHRFVIRRA